MIATTVDNVIPLPLNDGDDDDDDPMSQLPSLVIKTAQGATVLKSDDGSVIYSHHPLLGTISGLHDGLTMSGDLAETWLIDEDDEELGSVLIEWELAYLLNERLGQFYGGDETTHDRCPRLPKLINGSLKVVELESPSEPETITNVVAFPLAAQS